MNAEPTSEARSPGSSGVTALESQTSARIRIGRWAFTVSAAAFAICVAVQIFIAGLAIFVHPLNWVRHTNFVHLFELVPILMLIFSVLGKMPARSRWQSAALFGLILLQYFTANFRAVVPWVAALHPLVAMVIMWLALEVMVEGWRSVTNRGPV